MKPPRKGFWDSTRRRVKSAGGIQESAVRLERSDPPMRRLLQWLGVFSRRRTNSLLGLFTAGLVCGALFWGGFRATVEWTNTNAFCISCHSMEANAYKEYKETLHYFNGSGVRTTCADCHVPKEFGPKLTRKLFAAKDIYYHLIGTIDSEKKYDAKRMEMAQTVWRYMRDSDSRECRSCHTLELMNLKTQSARASWSHQQMVKEGSTCIDCHQGIAHHLPDQFQDPFYE